jgi:hypothetical protein
VRLSRSEAQKYGLEEKRLRRQTEAERELRRLQKKRLVEDFNLICQNRGIWLPSSEVVFEPERRWRFDFAWPAQKLALEIQGGIWTAGRHVRGAALLREWEKLNQAAILGWRILYASPDQVYKTGEIFPTIRKALEIK